MEKGFVIGEAKKEEAKEEKIEEKVEEEKGVIIGEKVGKAPMVVIVEDFTRLFDKWTKDLTKFFDDHREQFAELPFFGQGGK